MSSMKFSKVIIVISVIVLLFINVGCRKLVELNTPSTSTNAENIYSNDATAASVLTGVYARMSATNANLATGDITSISLFTGLTADELKLFNTNDPIFQPYYTNNLSALAETGGEFWKALYPYIFVANSVIEGLTNPNSLTPVVRQQLLGEAKFVRAFCYFYLVNLYGDIPLATTSDWKINSLLHRAPKEEVYQQIIADLLDAQNILSSDYVKSDAQTIYPMASEERVRPTKWAASALLARVYLYIGNFANAEAQATIVINNSRYFGLEPLSSVFLKNSRETIWAFQPVGDGSQANTGEGSLFILPETGPNTSDYPIYLSDNLVNSFENGDQRKSIWVDSVNAAGINYYYPFKYKVGKISASTSEYIMILRLAEQYLIRAEARAEQNNIGGAQDDLNTIRVHAGLPNTNAVDRPSLITGILHEKRVELFTEWGHRWFDLKRTNNLDELMSTTSPDKGGNWSSFKAVFPIPQVEVTSNPNLIQNTGY